MASVNTMEERYCKVIYQELHFRLAALQLQDHYQLSQQVYEVEVVVLLLYAYLVRAIAQMVLELQFGICQISNTKQRSATRFKLNINTCVENRWLLGINGTF